MANEIKDLPVADLFSNDELSHMCMLAALARKGIADPVKFHEDHDVQYTWTLKGKIGLAVFITKIEKRKVPLSGAPLTSQTDPTDD